MIDRTSHILQGKRHLTDHFAHWGILGIFTSNWPCNINFIALVWIQIHADFCCCWNAILTWNPDFSWNWLGNNLLGWNLQISVSVCLGKLWLFWFDELKRFESCFPILMGWKALFPSSLWWDSTWRRQWLPQDMEEDRRKGEETVSKMNGLHFSNRWPIPFSDSTKNKDQGQKLDQKYASSSLS